MASDKHRAVWDWLQDCPYIGDLFFNAGVVKDGCTVLIPSDKLSEEYIDGSERHWYDCALTRFQSFSADANDAANIEVVSDLEELCDWVRAQSKAGNFPAFPEGFTVEDIRVMPNESGFMTAQDMSMAKYMIQFRVQYTTPPAPDDDWDDED